MFGFEKLDVWQKAIEIGYGSTMEVVSEAFIGRRQGYLSEQDFQKLYAAAEEISRMLSGLRTSLLKE